MLDMGLKGKLYFLRLLAAVTAIVCGFVILANQHAPIHVTLQERINHINLVSVVVSCIRVTRIRLIRWKSAHLLPPLAAWSPNDDAVNALNTGRCGAVGCGGLPFRFGDPALRPLRFLFTGIVSAEYMISGII